MEEKNNRGLYFNLLKWVTDQMIQLTRHDICKYFKSGIIHVQNWRVCELLKNILTKKSKKTTNEPTAGNYISDTQ
jgi:hypothetical protein